MTDLLQQGSAWLEGQRTRHMTRDVTYLRGAGEVEVLATVGKTVFRVDAAYGARERHESRDYLVLAADLVLGGLPLLPKAGDQIREVEGDKGYLYEVMAPGGEPPWRYSDLYRRTLRIHTKLVGTEDLGAVDLGLSASGRIDLSDAALAGGVAAGGSLSSSAELEMLGLSAALVGSLSQDEVALLGDMVLTGAISISDVALLGGALQAIEAALQGGMGSGLSLVELADYAIANGISATLDAMAEYVLPGLAGQAALALSEADLTGNLSAFGLVTALFELSLLGLPISVQFAAALIGRAELAMPQVALAGDVSGSAAVALNQADVVGLTLSGSALAELRQPVELLGGVSGSALTGLEQVQLDGVALSGSALAVVMNRMETTVGALSGSASVGLVSAVLTAVTLTTDLVFACKFDETAGTDITDWKGGKVGTVSGGYTLNQAGPGTHKSILFDGSSAFIQWTNAVLGTLLDMGSGSGSWEIWFKTSSGAAQSPLDKNQFSGGRFGTACVAPDAHGRGIILSGGGGPFVNDTAARNDGLWHQAVVVRDSVGGTFKIYVDGALKASVTTAIGSTNNTGGLFVGKRDNAPNPEDFFNGHLALPRVWVGRALSAADVTSLYNGGAGRDISL